MGGSPRLWRSCCSSGPTPTCWTGTGTHRWCCWPLVLLAKARDSDEDTLIEILRVMLGRGARLDVNGAKVRSLVRE